MEFRQYDVYIFDPEPVRGREVKKIRPCVIVSPDEINAFLGTIIIAPLTSKIRNYPFRPVVKLDRVSGCIMLDQIRCVDKSRLTRKVGSLTVEEARIIKGILKEMLVD